MNLDYKEWVKIFNAAKIVLIIHYQDGNTVCHQASPKVYEAMACRTFVLVDRQKDIFSLFEDKNHLISFTNISDLKNKITYYKIATRGYREVLEKHTYIHRIREMLSMLKNSAKDISR